MIHGLPEEPYAQVEISNFWTVDDLEAAAVVPPSSWSELLTTARASMRLLVFSDQIIEQLRPRPFHPGVARRIRELLQILEDPATETDEDFSLSAAGIALQQRHFVGEKASFSDESAANKTDFKRDLTFRDPAGGGEDLFCPWHGKIKIGQYRIHFEWPRPKGQRQIKVVYIGPKKTKR